MGPPFLWTCQVKETDWRSALHLPGYCKMQYLLVISNQSLCLADPTPSVDIIVCMQSAHRKMLDTLNSVGLSDSLLRVIDRRQTFDKLLVYGGMVSLLQIWSCLPSQRLHLQMSNHVADKHVSIRSTCLWSLFSLTCLMQALSCVESWCTTHSEGGLHIYSASWSCWWTALDCRCSSWSLWDFSFGGGDEKLRSTPWNAASNDFATAFHWTLHLTCFWVPV